LNIAVINKSVTVKVKKIEIEVAASLWCHCSTATVDHPSEVVASWGKTPTTGSPRHQWAQPPLPHSMHCMWWKQLGSKRWDNVMSEIETCQVIRLMFCFEICFKIKNVFESVLAHTLQECFLTGDAAAP